MAGSSTPAELTEPFVVAPPAASDGAAPRRDGNHKIIEQFLADGLNHMFGNPGTVEQGFLDAVGDYPAMKYILTLQESIAVMMADGYARATQKPTLVQLHSSPGIGNAVGALYQAKRGHSPLVVIGADAGLQYMNMDAQMANDLVAMMAPVTKYSTVVLSPKSLLRTLRRAIKIAATPPMGTVYVCLPMDVLDALNDEEVVPTSLPSTRVLPAPALIDEAARYLLAAETPVIFAGDGVAYSQANDELVQVAELLGAEVYGVDFGDTFIDTTHPLYKGTTGHMFGDFSLPPHHQRRRESDSGHLHAARGFSASGERVEGRCQSHSLRPEWLRNRQKPPRRPWCGQRPQAVAAGAGGCPLSSSARPPSSKPPLAGWPLPTQLRTPLRWPHPCGPKKENRSKWRSLWTRSP